MTQPAARRPLSAAALSGTDEYEARFRYRESPRASHSVEDISVAQLGHMVETLKDAALFMRHVMLRPHLDVGDDRVYKLQNPGGLPDYLTHIASNFLAGGSFHRTDDPRREKEVKKHPDVVAFMNIMHGAMRRQTLQIGKLFVVPEEISGLVGRYDALIDEYKGFLKTYANEDGSPNYRNIPRKVMQEYAERFNPVADELEAALRALPSVEVDIDGQRRALPNDRLVNDRLDKTYPAAVLWAFRTLGMGAADRHQRPAMLEYEPRQRTLIGAQSMITDTMQGLFDLAAESGFAFEGCDINRTQLQAQISQYTRSFQLLLNFCRTADCGYDVMYGDLENFIQMGGGRPELGEFQNPEEVALMLCAVERRLAREDKNPPLRTILYRLADEMSHCTDMDEVRGHLESEPALQSILKRTVRAVEKGEMESALPVLRELAALAPEANLMPGRWQVGIVARRADPAEGRAAA